MNKKHERKQEYKNMHDTIEHIDQYIHTQLARGAHCEEDFRSMIDKHCDELMRLYELRERLKDHIKEYESAGYRVGREPGSV